MEMLMKAITQGHEYAFVLEQEPVEGWTGLFYRVDQVVENVRKQEIGSFGQHRIEQLI